MKTPRKTFALSLLALTQISACGPTSEEINPISAPPTDPVITLEQKVAAATKTANQNAACTALGPFYWEIGDQAQLIVSGSTGDGSIARSTGMSIASASKWIYGAYVVQKMNGKMDAEAIKYLTMNSGYTSLNDANCGDTTSVLDCFNAGHNSRFTAANENKFDYNGGHFQKYAVDHGLASLGPADLQTEIVNTLGGSLSPFIYTSPELAGGVATTAEQYSKFLQRILDGTLKIREHLGENAVCTFPGVCATAVNSPAPENFLYSYGHWVETNPTDPLADGAYSSAGAFGFYPWIDASKTYYGILARHEVDPNDSGKGFDSLMCGRLIRKAFFSGVAVQ